MNPKLIYLHRTQARFAEGEHIRGMIQAFQQLGYEIDIVGPPGIDIWKKPETPNSASPSWKKKAWSLVSDHMPQIFFEGLEFGFNLYGYARLRRLLSQYQYDFIYERYALNTAYVNAAAGGRIKHVLEVNDATVIERSRRLILKGISAKLEKRIFEQTDLIVTITQHFKECIVAGHGIDPEKIIVTPNAVNPDKFALDPSKRISKQEAGIQNQYVIGCVGAFLPWHGLDFLVNAIHDIVKQYDIHILFVGDGPVRKNVESLAIKLNIADYLTFTGFIAPHQVPYYINLMDICVIPGSNPHCSPVKLFEYLAMGKPVVLPNYRPLIETIDHEREGLFFNIDQGTEMANCIVRLINNEEQRLRMGSQAQKTVLSKYTWEINARNIICKLESRS